jgi:hypothetical protein
MPSVSLTYRLTIRNASSPGNPNGTADALVVTSLRGGTNPFIAEPPSGDGFEVDPLTGITRTGAYQVLIVDPITTGTSRLVTSQLMDAGNRQQLLNRRAYIEVSTDGGSNWSTVQAGYVTAIRLVDAITYEVVVGDTRRIERQRQVFETDDSTYFPVRGAALGGPIVGGPFGPIPERKGLVYVVTGTTALTGGTRVDARFESGYKYDGQATSRWQDVVNPFGRPPAVGTIRSEIGAWAESYWAITPAGGVGQLLYGFPELAFRVYGFLLGTKQGDFLPLETRARDIGGDVVSMFWTGSAPSVGTRIRVSLITRQASNDCPIYISEHPVDIARKLYEQAGIPVDTASFTALRALIGDDVRVSLRITQPQGMAEFIEKTLAGPFGIGLRTNASGQMQAFSTRIKTTTLPSVTIATSTLRESGSAFDLDESTIVTKVTLDSQSLALFRASPFPSDVPSDLPRDGILVSKETHERLNADADAIGDRELRYTVPGMVHTAAAFTSTAATLATAIAGEIFDRYGRGVHAADLACLRGAGADGVQVGEEVYVQTADLPNLNKRIGDDPSVGARIMQVVRRTETPDGPTLRVLDSGVAAQPVSAPTISIAASTTFPLTVARFTITNAATLNSAGLTVAIEWATGSTTPTGSGADFARYDAPNIPTGAVDLPPVVAGSTVWVRARTEQAGRRPSAWTAWANVTLTALPVPSGLAASDIKQNAVTLAWTNTSSTARVRVKVAPSAASNTAEAAWIVADMLPGTTRTTVRGLQGPSVAYTARVAYLDDSGNEGTAATTTFTTSSTSDVAARPAGIAVLTATGPTADAGLPTGIAVAAWAADTAYQLVLERAPDSGGTPGTFAEIAVLPGTTTVYVDELPGTGVVYWYRWRHRLGGYSDSAATCARSGIAAGVPPGLVRPDIVPPAVSAEVSEVGTTGTVTLTLADPQCRVVQVRFRHRVQPSAWSAWTVDTTAPYSYSETIPSSGFLEIEWEVQGYDGAGALVVLGTAIEYFDADVGPPVANITGLSVTYTQAGQAFITIVADSDTQSIKFATSTSSPPSLGTVQAQSPINTRNTVIQSVVVPIDGILYVSAVGYTGLSGGGSEGPLSTGSFPRDGAPPQVTAISLTFTQVGEGFLILTGDGNVGSMKYAVSTSAAPNLATVQAASATNGRQVNATLPGPYNVGATVYVSALAYRSTGGGGQEGPLTSIAFVRQGDDLRVVEALSESATLGTLDLTVYDPTQKVASVRARGMPGHAAWSSYSTLTNTGTATVRQHQATVTLVEKVPSKIEYQVLGPDLTGNVAQVLATNTITFAMGAKPFPPEIFATVRENGQVDVAVIGDSDTASLRIGFSTASQAAANAALGSTTNLRQNIFLNIGTLTLGQRGYIAAQAYSGTGASGEASVIAEANVIYSNVNTSKVVWLNFTEFKYYGGFGTLAYDTGYTYVYNSDADDVVFAVATFTLPPGTQMTSWSSYMYDDGTAPDALTVQLLRLSATGSLVGTLGIMPNPRLGWNLAAVSLSETVSTNTYMVLAFIRADGTTLTHQRIANIAITYTSPNLIATL